MNSPFPGMDPFLESPEFWPDFHARFITYCCDAISDLLPERYEVRIDERLNLVELPAGDAKLVKPDLAISQSGSGLARNASGARAFGLEPVTIPHALLEEVRETRIEILHRSGRELVTVIELLSPANKSDSNSAEYRAKRLALLRRPVHLVELDLLVGGRRLPLLRDLPPGDYYAFISRSDRRPDCEVYVWTVRDPLPMIPVPLKAPDPDLRVHLGELFSVVYERGRYGRSVDYSASPRCPLNEKDQRWVLEQAGAKPGGATPNKPQ